jgi:hypothetical protein
LLISWANGEIWLLSETEPALVAPLAVALVFEPVFCSAALRIDCREAERLLIELLISFLSAIPLRF